MKRSVVGLIEDPANQSYALSFKAYQENVDFVLKLARKYNIPIVHNTELVSLLDHLPVEQEIPIELLPALKIILDRLSKN